MDAYEEFQSLSDEARAIAMMYASWAPTYDRMLEGVDINRYEAADVVARTAIELTGSGDVPNILDLATGTGAVLRQLRTSFRHAAMTGLDISDRMMEKARMSGAGIKNLKFCDIEKMRWPVANDSMDLITCAGALSMIGDLGHVMNETKRTLKPDGIAVMSFLIASRKDKGDFGTYSGFRTYQRYPYEMEQAIEQAGLKVVKRTDGFVGFSGRSFQETHGVIAFSR